MLRVIVFLLSLHVDCAAKVDDARSKEPVMRKSSPEGQLGMEVSPGGKMTLSSLAQASQGPADASLLEEETFQEDTGRWWGRVRRLFDDGKKKVDKVKDDANKKINKIKKKVKSFEETVRDLERKAKRKIRKAQSKLKEADKVKGCLAAVSSDKERKKCFRTIYGRVRGTTMFKRNECKACLAAVFSEEERKNCYQQIYGEVSGNRRFKSFMRVLKKENKMKECLGSKGTSESALKTCTKEAFGRWKYSQVKAALKKYPDPTAGKLEECTQKGVCMKTCLKAFYGRDLGYMKYIEWKMLKSKKEE